MSRTAYKFAASTLIVSLTMIGSTAQSVAMRRGFEPVQATGRTDRQAAEFHAQGARALQQGQLAVALAAMEQAVALSPRDAGYRLLLADIYLRSGRFDSARATYSDVIELDPANARAGLTYALIQTAQGRPEAAIGRLDDLQGRAAPADLGLAYALAGLPQRAIEILAPAARGHDATPRLRQNLALSYALAGDWRRARAIAAQDVSPAELGARMEQWAALARPDAARTRVASLIGVAPGEDPGQPVRLALAQPAAIQVAQAEPVVAPVAVAEAAPAAVQEDAPAPLQAIQFAQAAAVETAPARSESDWGLPATPAPTRAAAPIAETAIPASEAATYYTPTPRIPAAPRSLVDPQVQAAARALTRPTRAVVRTASVSLPSAPVFRRAVPAAPAVRSGNSRFVVQLGAFSNQQNAERAWLDASRRFGLNGRAPLTATVDMNGRTLHRVAIAGFASQSDAQRLCGSIQARGGVCFVRTQAGDASIRWAARYANGRNRNV